MGEVSTTEIQNEMLNVLTYRGKGLGKNEDGQVDPLQIKRREEGQALGAVNESPAATFKWSDTFWVDMYNSTVQKIKE